MSARTVSLNAKLEHLIHYWHTRVQVIGKRPRSDRWEFGESARENGGLPIPLIPILTHATEKRHCLLSGLNIGNNT